MYVSSLLLLSENVWHKAFSMGYSMRLELTLVSSINDLWLVKLVYIGVLVSLSWSLLSRLWYLMFAVVCVWVCWHWSGFGFHKWLFSCVWVCIMGSFVVLNLLVVLSPFFCICIYMYIYVCVCFEFFFLSSENMFGMRYGTPVKLVDKFTYLGSSIASIEKDIDTRLTKAWTAFNRLSIIWKSDLTDKMKRSFFQAAVTSILLYGCTTWTLTKRLEKKLDGNYTRMLQAILNKSWRQHLTRHQLYGHLPPITKTIQVRRTRHAGHCWRSRDELISDVLLWTPTHGYAKAGRPARTYIQQLCEDTGCCPEDLPEAMNDREKWRERVRDIRAISTTWWWWWWNRF